MVQLIECVLHTVWHSRTSSSTTISTILVTKLSLQVETPIFHLFHYLTELQKSLSLSEKTHSSTNLKLHL